MNAEYPYSRPIADAARKKGGSAKFVLIVAGLAFLFGAVAVGYGLYSFGYLGGDETASPVVAVGTDLAEQTANPASVPPPAATPPRALPNETPVETVERVVEQQGGIDQRLAAAEQRIARLDLQAQAASGNAARAEGLLIAFAVRRTLERGEQLGLLGDQLQLRFGNAQPNAVEAVMALAAKPVTLERLITRLDRLTPQLSEGTEEATGARIRRELSELFVFRRADSDSPKPEKRLERAMLRLENGQIAAAILEVEQLPGSAEAPVQAWMADAHLLDRAQKAFDVIETTAILEPQRLRDAEGAAVEQPSPVAAN